MTDETSDQNIDQDIDQNIEPEGSEAETELDPEQLDALAEAEQAMADVGGYDC